MKTPLDFSSYISESAINFTGRVWVFEEINKWLAQPKGARFFLLTGAPGSGKTSLAARLSQFSSAQAIPPGSCKAIIPGFLTAIHFCKAGEDTWIDPLQFTRALATQLLERFPQEYQAALDISETAYKIYGQAQAQTTHPGAIVAGVYIENLVLSGIDPVQAFNIIIRNPLETLYKGGFHRSITILVDSLDEALTYPDTVTIVRLLAGLKTLPALVRFILTSRKDGRVESNLREREGIFISEPKHRSKNRLDISEYVENRLSNEQKLAEQLADTSESHRSSVVTMITNKAEENFLYVRFLLKAMVLGQRSLEELDGLPAGLDGLYADSLKRVIALGENGWLRSYAPVMGILSVSQEALTFSQLRLFVGSTASELWNYLGNLEQFVEMQQPSGQGDEAKKTYVLYHRSLVDFFRRQSLGTGEESNFFFLLAEEWHRRITDFYLKTFQGRWSDCDVYGLRHLAWHLREAERFDELRILLLTFDWLQAKLEAIDVYALVSDYDYLSEEKDLDALKSAIHLSAHILARDPKQLPGQLTARLLANISPGIQALLRQAAELKSWSWLRPLKSSLAAPGGSLIRTLEGHVHEVETVAVLPDGWHAVSGSRDHTLRLWNLKSGQAVHAFEGHAGPVRAVGITPDGRHAVSGSEDHTLRLWDIENGQTVRIYQGHTHWVMAVAITPDGRHALSGSRDHTLRLWDLQSGETVRIFSIHTDLISAVQFTPDGRRVVSASWDETLQLWDLESGEVVRIFRVLMDSSSSITVKPNATSSIAVTPDGRRVLSIWLDGVLRLWDLESGKNLDIFRARRHPIGAVTVTPDGRRALFWSDRVLWLWDLENGKSLGALKGHTHVVNAVAATPDGLRAVSASSDRTLRIWKLEINEIASTPEEHTDQVHIVAVTPDGLRAVSASWDHTLRLWDFETAQTLRIVKGPVGGVSALAITPDGRIVVSSWSDGTLQLWNLKGDQTIRTVSKSMPSFSAVAVTPDGRRAVSASYDRMLRLWDLENDRIIRTFKGYIRYADPVAITPDGRRAVSAWEVCYSTQHTLCVWDLKHRKKFRVLEGHTNRISDVVITPDGQRAVSASWDQTLRVWDLESNRMIRRLEGHTDRVNAAAVTPDGRYAVSGSEDQTLRMWNLESGEVIVTFMGESSMVSCAVTPSGRTIAGGDDVGRIHFLRLVGR